MFWKDTLILCIHVSLKPKLIEVRTNNFPNKLTALGQLIRYLSGWHEKEKRSVKILLNLQGVEIVNIFPELHV